VQVNTEREHRLLLELMDAAGGIEIAWLRLPPGNPLVGKTLAEAKLRARTGASVVAIMRNRHLLANPKSVTVFEPEDRIGLIGDREQIEAAEELLAASDAGSSPPASEMQLV
jgi:CPA2 family monovalent cation:H+ antiporter-2